MSDAWPVVTPATRAPLEFRFSDYGEWLDEGTTELLNDVVSRSPETPSEPVRPSDLDIIVGHDEALQRYGAWIDTEEIGYLSYKLVGHRVVLWSTMILPAYRNHGVATELIAKALDDIRATGKTITIVCPIVWELIRRHPQYQDLVDKAHPGVVTKSSD
jgi:predicted GNAT family acetyltransferase